MVCCCHFPLCLANPRMCTKSVKKTLHPEPHSLTYCICNLCTIDVVHAVAFSAGRWHAIMRVRNSKTFLTSFNSLNSSARKSVNMVNTFAEQTNARARVITETPWPVSRQKYDRRSIGDLCRLNRLDYIYFEGSRETCYIVFLAIHAYFCCERTAMMTVELCVSIFHLIRDWPTFSSANALCQNVQTFISNNVKDHIGKAICVRRMLFFILMTMHLLFMTTFLLTRLHTMGRSSCSYSVFSSGWAVQHEVAGC
jgi:hypothetical protein